MRAPTAPHTYTRRSCTRRSYGARVARAHTHIRHTWMERQRNAIRLTVLTNTDARRARCSRCSSRVRRGWKYGRARTTRPLDTTRSRNRSKETEAASSIDHRGNRHRSTEQRHLHDATVPTLARNSVFLYGWLRCNHQQRHQRPHQPTHIRTKASPHVKTHFHTHLLLLRHPPRVRVFSRNKLSLSLNRTHRRPNTMTQHDRPTPPIRASVPSTVSKVAERAPRFSATDLAETIKLSPTCVPNLGEPSGHVCLSLECKWAVCMRRWLHSFTKSVFDVGRCWWNLDDTGGSYVCRSWEERSYSRVCSLYVYAVMEYVSPIIFDRISGCWNIRYKYSVVRRASQ